MTATVTPPALPLVSIITPSLEQASLIEQTILSVQQQTYANIEHIVVDGGSTDGTLDILRRHAGTPGFHWVSEPDSGMYDAINKGIGRARGEIVAYLNSDDLYFPWTIAAVVAAFAADPAADVVFGDALSVDDRSGRCVVLMHPPFHLDWVRRVGFLAQPAVFWRRRVLDRFGGFDASLRLVADCDFWMRIGAGARFRLIDEFLAIDRIHQEGLRAARSAALASELSTVRGRYVQMAGLVHVSRMAYDRVVAAMGRRIRWIRFAQASGRRRSSGPWGGLLGDRSIEFSRRAILLGLIPGLGRLVRAEAIRRPSGWFPAPRRSAGLGDHDSIDGAGAEVRDVQRSVRTTAEAADHEAAVEEDARLDQVAGGRRVGPDTQEGAGAVVGE